MPTSLHAVRRATTRPLLTCAAVIVGCWAKGAASEEPAELPPPAARTVDFVADVQPILVAACQTCHGPDKQKSGYRLDVRAIALKGGDIGGAIVPGDSAASPLIRFVAGVEADLKMPPEGTALTAEQVGILRAWIDQGAAWPDAADVKLADKADHWAYRPLSRPAIPATRQTDWVRTPIDAFILAALESRGLAPSAPADKRVLIRRLTFDLHGLPPTPTEIDVFLSDDTPDACERLIDRLLDSPRYGERWARHWMDVVHFAETHGHDQDRPRPHAWPYRDYLIRSFNQDKTYARFAAEQLAGDILFPEDPWGVVATGLIAAGPWDESSQLSIVDDTVDKKIARNLDRDDMVATAMSTFTSSTVQCARCHDHKFDPISQDDYYALQAVFAGVDRANRSYEADPLVRQQRQMLLSRKAELEKPTEQLLSSLTDSAISAEVNQWLAKVESEQGVWTLLEPATVESAGGATPAGQPDYSVLFGGDRPESDTYTLTAPTPQSGVTAVRLEVLTDPSLAHQGPGRQDNGNLHLTEFQVFVAPLADPANRQSVSIRSATADFNQSGWTIEMAIDGNPGTAWGIYPEVGKPHLAVFEFQQPVGFEGGTLFTFVLEQKHGGGHLIGRPRLAITTSPPPVRAAQAQPEKIAAALATPADQRNTEQNRELALHVLKLRNAEQLAALPAAPMVYAAASDFVAEGAFTPAKTPRPVFVLRRGDVNQPLAEAQPGALSCLPGLNSRFSLADPANEGARRAALAQWVTAPENPLTWRSLVNRVWHYHFGRGIVDSPNDFGHMGASPTHPELLDWLAVTFLEQGGSLKQLHRLILSSAVYRQSSQHNEAFALQDAGNLYLWRMNRARLDAESVRDAVLCVTGKLDSTMGGPSVKQFIESPGIHVTPMVDYANFNVDAPESFRRSVYRFLFRTLPDPFMDSMDCADASQLTPARNTSVTAIQALAMLNNHFIVRQSEHLAERLRQESPEISGQIDVAYRLALGRSPTPRESSAVSSYAARHGLANACRLILNSNEFLFVP